MIHVLWAHEPARRIAADRQHRRVDFAATRACAQNVTAPKVNHRTEVNNQDVVGETPVLVLHCVLHFVQDRAGFESRPCLTQ
jgi:hypothetical protein